MFDIIIIGKSSGRIWIGLGAIADVEVGVVNVTGGFSDKGGVSMMIGRDISCCVDGGCLVR
jgi:hypothetical protein